MYSNKIRFFVTIFIIFLLVVANYYNKQKETSISNNTNSEIEQLFANKVDKTWVQGIGKIEKVLKDDLQGAKHQRFIVRIGENLTLLISHNIDIAPKIINLRRGDSISFYGEYIWNKKGGLIHWTHHDPNGRKDGGWLRHKEKIYR